MHLREAHGGGTPIDHDQRDDAGHRRPRHYRALPARRNAGSRAHQDICDQSRRPEAITLDGAVSDGSICSCAVSGATGRIISEQRKYIPEPSEPAVANLTGRHTASMSRR
jgi:hypothetical protein